MVLRRTPHRTATRNTILPFPRPRPLLLPLNFFLQARRRARKKKPTKTRAAGVLSWGLGEDGVVRGVADEVEEVVEVLLLVYFWCWCAYA